MAFAKNIGKKQIFFNLHGGLTFLYLGSSQIINDPPQFFFKKNQKNKTPLNAISDAQF
jgi:hypothetical protein